MSSDANQRKGISSIKKNDRRTTQNRVKIKEPRKNGKNASTENDSESSGSSSDIISIANAINAGKLRKKRARDVDYEESLVSIKPKTKGQLFCEWLVNNINRIFSFPFFSGERICFHRDDLEPTDPKELKAAWRQRKKVEDLVNFDSVATMNMYANILEQRKQILESKNKYHFEDVDLTKYPQWDQNIINRHRATFQIFDISGDGVIDFEEFSTVLSEFGDNTTPEIRLKYFSKAKTDEFGTIGFEDFLMIAYELTENGIESPADQSLLDSFKKIDSNMAIRCKLDVLGQLQGGLF